ncbi:MAG: 2-isopropylmalate synthase [Pirellulaceae bacterium]|nr:2-isopropylmalate synthase [Pirellulaceae bacterium]
MSHQKYRPYLSQFEVPLADRRWPDNQITAAPVWCSVDLRDGNQALVDPMTFHEKMELFRLLVEIGFEQIEVGFPAAAQVEFDFTRALIDQRLLPDHVIPQVLTQARPHLIDRTFEAIDGCRQAIVHLYNSTSILQRRVVFRMEKPAILELAVRGAEQVRELAGQTSTDILLEYSPESFTGTELPFALEVCEAVIEVWQPTPQRPIILNIPATVEMTTPNVYADQVEWFSRHLSRRDSVILSVHTHNDRGTSVAATELGLLAGAQRVEGTLFGYGERTGNVDIVTVALNMMSQGVDPKLDLREVPRIREIVHRCTRTVIHPRHPYAGDLVFTAFSGSHQDAINKGLQARQKSPDAYWEVPYLAIDPADIGRRYEALIRVNSQSGKGGVAYILRSVYHCELPREMQPEFAAVIQELSERLEKEVPADMIWDEFAREYLQESEPYRLRDFQLEEVSPETIRSRLHLKFGGEDVTIEGTGNGPIAASVEGLRRFGCPPFRLVHYSEHARSSGEDAEAIAYIGLESPAGVRRFGAGLDRDTTKAELKALVSALNRLYRATRQQESAAEELRVSEAARWIETELGCELPDLLFEDLLETCGELARGRNGLTRQSVAELLARHTQDTGPYRFVDFSASRSVDQRVHCTLTLEVEGARRTLAGVGQGPIAASVHALCAAGVPAFTVTEYFEKALGKGADSDAIAFLALVPGTEPAAQAGERPGPRVWGLGIDPSTEKAELKALLAAVNRLLTESHEANAASAASSDVSQVASRPRAS